VAQAVSSNESARDFPANREINREFWKNTGAGAQIHRQRCIKINGLGLKLPTHRNRELNRKSRELFSTIRDFCSLEQAPFLRGLRAIFGIRLGYYVAGVG
jgi:hypothetical protein